jgi:DNA-binding Xre family transcriptional regulator
MRINSHQQEQHATAKEDLRQATGLSPASIAKLGRDGNVTIDVLARICQELNVQLTDICQINEKEGDRDV